MGRNFTVSSMLGCSRWVDVAAISIREPRTHGMPHTRPRCTYLLARVMHWGNCSWLMAFLSLYGLVCEPRVLRCLTMETKKGKWPSGSCEPECWVLCPTEDKLGKTTLKERRHLFPLFVRLLTQCVFLGHGKGIEERHFLATIFSKQRTGIQKAWLSDCRRAVFDDASESVNSSAL